MDEKKAKDLFDAQIKKKLILKKKSDKEYEAYWIKQKGKECSCITFTTLTHQGQEICCYFLERAFAHGRSVSDHYRVSSVTIIIY